MTSIIKILETKVQNALKKGSVQSTDSVSNMKMLLRRLFLFALWFTISQADIAARTLTLMQGSEGKK